MPTSSVFDKFIIDSNEKLKLLLKEKDDKDKRKTPKIDILKRIENGKNIRKFLKCHFNIPKIIPIFSNDSKGKSQQEEQSSPAGLFFKHFLFHFGRHLLCLLFVFLPSIILK